MIDYVLMKPRLNHPVRITLDLEREDLAALDEHAHREGRDRSGHIRQVLRQAGQFALLATATPVSDPARTVYLERPCGK